jgi:hypothetical protein
VTKHVVAEVLIDGRWVIADPAYRVLWRDAAGHLLTREDLRNPAVFAQAIQAVPQYPKEYTYERFAHVRVARVPLLGLRLRWLLDQALPGWEERLDWTLLLERESFFVLCVSGIAFSFFLVVRLLLGWYADHRLKMPRFRFRARFLRAGSTFFHAPEIK